MYSFSSCRFACTKPIGLLSSWATPATSWPRERIFSLCTSWAWVRRSSSVRSSTRASRVSFSFAISSNALAFSMAIELWLARVRSSWRSSAARRSPESLRPTATMPSRSTPYSTGTSSSTSRVSKTSRQSSRTSGSSSSSKSPRASSSRRIQSWRQSGWSMGSWTSSVSSSQSPRAAATAKCCWSSPSSSTIARSRPIESVTASRMRSTISCTESIETIASEISRTALR